MEFERVIEKRFSCRAFDTSKSISNDILYKIIKLSQKAPSAGNLQAYRVVVVKNSALKKKLAKAALDQTFLADAQALLVISASPSSSEIKYRKRGRELYALQDATIFAAYCELISKNFGLASVWVGAFSEEQVKNTLIEMVPLHFIEKPIAIIAIGFCSEDNLLPTPRFDINRISILIE